MNIVSETRAAKEVRIDNTLPAETNPPISIRVEGITKTYGMSRTTARAAGAGLLRRLTGRPGVARDSAVTAVKDISFEIRRGECVGMIGRNGSGKSTLLKIIAGVLRPTSGSVTTRGRIESMLELGIGFNPEFTGRENIYLYATMLGMDSKQIEQRHAEVAAFAEIGEFMDRLLKHYSSGMVLRLAFAAFVLMRPEILIIDEALSVGDIFFQQRCHDFLRGTLANATKIVVSHDPGALSALCTRLLILDRGRLDYDGPIAPGIERYLKSLHNEGARSGTGSAAASTGERTTGQAAPPEAIPWVTLPEEQLSGRGALRIVQAAVTDPEGRAVQGREPGQRVVVHMIVRVVEPCEHLMFGYLLRDGTGQQVCGQNSWILRDPRGGRFELDLPEAGDWHAVLEFDWPALKPQPYTLTLGIGEGFDAHHHVVQCWAHDCFLIAGFDPDKAVHGLFGSNLVDCRCQKL